MIGLTTGFFDAQGNACLKFHIHGVIHKPPGIELEGIIDTGFTGFLQLPMHHAFTLKLPLDGTLSATLADGSKVTCLTVLGKVTYDGHTQQGVIALATATTDILIGMDFLRQFKLGLMVIKGQIMLVQEDWLDDMVKKNAPATEAPAAAGGGPDIVQDLKT